MAINKVVYGGDTLMDITDTTAGANDVVSGKTFYAANGVKTTGTASIPEPATVAPLKDGTAAVGTSAKYAREDHVHPISLLDAYPVGVFYISAVATSPAELFGGTWVRIQGQFLLAAADEEDIGTEPDYSVCYRVAGATGGSERITLSEAQMPAHTHGIKWLSGSVSMRPLSSKTSSALASPSGIVTTPRSSGTFTGGLNYTGIDATKGWDIHVSATHEHDSVGSGESHGNMPPYLAVYVWQRIA